jgi:hypothetical protein
MGLLETDHAPNIIRLLEKARNNGSQYVVLEMRNMDMQLRPYDLEIFKTLDEALDYLDEKDHEYLPGGEEHPIYYQPIDKFLAEIKLANSLTILTPPVRTEMASDNQLNSKIMNLNNLQDLKKEVAGLGFSPKTADELEKNMRQLPPHFVIKDQLPGDKGQVDLTLHFHKSGVSDTFNFSKYEATAGRVPPSADNQSYMVLTENKDNKEKPLVKTFESPNEAIDFFKKQKGNSELALGESPESKQILASKEKGKDNFVHDDFRGAYYSPAIKQTFYVKDGAGFSASQAANMVQGRTVHRENLINPIKGEAYNAWIKLDISQGKDGWGNFKLKQMNDPAFGFNLEKTLKDFKIKDLSDPAKKEGIIAAIKNGDRVEVTAVNREGKEVKVKAEADPQYKTLNFFTEKGTREKREQYKKPDVTQSQGRGQGKANEKELEQSQGIGVR